MRHEPQMMEVVMGMAEMLLLILRLEDDAVADPHLLDQEEIEAGEAVLHLQHGRLHLLKSEPEPTLVNDLVVNILLLNRGK